MLATSSGVVRELYKGVATKYKATGLKPHTEYIFGVKAAYDDGSYTWSSSKAFMTAI
jgi:hypothetical protein